MTETALYFGLSRPDGTVTQREWEAFRDDILVTQFSDGFTIVEGDGYWRNPKTGRSASEPSKVLVRIHSGSKSDQAATAQVIETYKAKFQQHSVLRVDNSVCAVF